MILAPAALASLFLRAFGKLCPSKQIRNPIVFSVYVGFGLALCLWLNDLLQGAPSLFSFSLAVILLLTILFSAMGQLYAEDKDKEQASLLKTAQGGVEGKKIASPEDKARFVRISAALFKQGDLYFAEAGDLIPLDGEIVEGIASLDESAMTGESAPVIREAKGDRAHVIAGTRVLSDWIVARVLKPQGQTRFDDLLAVAESTKRKKTPDETALEIFFVVSTLSFLIACTTLYSFSTFLAISTNQGASISLGMLIGLFVCLAPTTVGGVMPLIGLAGGIRLKQAGIIATSGHAMETAGDVDIVLMDKTGTATFGNRKAIAFYAAPGVSPHVLAKGALLASLADETPEGRSVLDLAVRTFGLSSETARTEDMTFIPFSADTRLSGMRKGDDVFLKGADDALAAHIHAAGGALPHAILERTKAIARQGGTPLWVAQNDRLLGVVHLKDIVKRGLKTHMAALRALGVRSVMITGDNPLTAAAIAAEIGADDFIPQAVPETKLRFIRERQREGMVVAMIGDGANDVPALAQADVALVMNNGAQEAREVGNMIDLDSDPTKIVEIVRTGKQLLMTRGSLATFALASDMTKFAAVVPAVLTSAFPALAPMNILDLSSPRHALLASLLFNAFLILFLIPLATRGFSHGASSPGKILAHNLLVYGCGGLLAPIVGIKLLDEMIVLVSRFALGGGHA